MTAAAAFADGEVLARVSHVTADGIYVDAGRARGLQAGDIGIVKRDGQEVARVEVVATASESARLRLLGAPKEPPRAGDVVQFKPDARPREGQPDTTQPAKPKTPENGDDFVPLLEQYARAAKTTTKSDIFHGRVSLSQLIQTGSQGQGDYLTTLLGTSGSLDRIGGSPWALRWSGNASYRGGDAFTGSDLDGARIDVYELTLGRRFEKGGFVKFGRLLPRELSAAGFIDGVQAEMPTGSIHVGAIAGFKPTRDELAPSLDEPTAAAYATFESGKRGERYFTATIGGLAAWFDGELDRGAVLVDQHTELGALRVDASAEIDLDVGAGMRDGVRLTRLNAYASVDVAQGVALRVGANHYERLDNRAERAGLDPFTVFDDGYWRYFVGFRARAGERFSIDGEVGLIDDEGGNTTHWRAGVTHFDPFGVRGASVSLTVYNLEGAGSDGIGALLSGFFPLDGGRWMISPSASFRTIDSSGADVSLTEARVRIDFQASSAWSLFVSVGYSAGDFADRVVAEFGAAFRW